MKYTKELLLIAAIILYFLYNMMDNLVFFVGGTVCALPGVFDLYRTNCKDLQLFTNLVLVGSFLNIITTSYGIGGSIVFLVCCGITYTCLKNLKLFFNISLIICLWLNAFLYYKLFLLGTVNGDIFLQYGLSKNYPGSMLVIFNCLWAVWKFKHYHRMPLVLPIISTIMAFFLDGRSSLICMVLITVFCFVMRGKKMTLIMAVIFVALVVHYWGTIMEYYELTSLAEKGVETERSDIWRSYFNNLDFGSILFGLDTQNLPVLKGVGGNPHNSFLSFHRRMGLVGIAVLFFYIIKEIKVLIKKKMFVLLYFNFVLILRMFFDGMLVTAEDFFILTLFFMPLYFNNKLFNIESQLESNGNSWYEKLWDKIVVIL